MQDKLSISDLNAEIRELGERYPELKNDDLFVLWFLRAYITDDERLAAEAIAGGPNDKGIDGVFVDDKARSVFVLQGKYRHQVGNKTEARNDVLSFADTARILSSPETDTFKGFLEGMEPRTASLLERARHALRRRGYRLWLYYVTLGKCSTKTFDDARRTARSNGTRAEFDLIDGKRCMLLLRDYLDGVAPPIPSLELEMESGSAVKVNGILQRFDGLTDVESWVFSMKGSDVAELYQRSGIRVFARNIRGFLGDTPVNQSMVETLEQEPERFFYYNNGITVVCDQAEKRSSKGKDFLVVGNPQIINGQQTTRTLAANAKHAANASVLVKVIQVPRENGNGNDHFDSLISQIVAGTNWQNAISAADLMANDRRQIEIEREFRKLGYLYVRKKQSKSEAKRLSTIKHQRTVKKEELARCVAGCELDPVLPRSGINNLFESELYPRVFPCADPNYYLPRYHLMRKVTYCSRGYPERGYAKWLVLRFMWKELNTMVRGARQAEAFRVACERQVDEVIVPLNRAIEKAFVAATKYYHLNRGKGAKAEDPSRFFRSKRGRDKEFAAFWKSSENKGQRVFNKHMANVEAGLKAFHGK
ncbi:hypothetical protein TspCOW1_01740 [Thiohalobacter sp. COW1]|uniref:AIPR family protein n=1 Tax=Thiohalobacter sp. COW1 TaxID=2795687 RepID=UPI0019155821|nr:AIPR family protein [Thiohalobacter sp. COW1]BCO30071.1 hypothetical protein TspCOW1_01740 [Thiohalobacter sp. COW1]